MGACSAPERSRPPRCDEDPACRLLAVDCQAHAIGAAHRQASRPQKHERAAILSGWPRARAKSRRFNREPKQEPRSEGRKPSSPQDERRQARELEELSRSGECEPRKPLEDASDKTRKRRSDKDPAAASPQRGAVASALSRLRANLSSRGEGDGDKPGDRGIAVVCSGFCGGGRGPTAAASGIAVVLGGGACNLCGPASGRGCQGVPRVTQAARGRRVAHRPPPKRRSCGASA